MKAIPRIGLMMAMVLVLASTASARAGWRKRVVVVQPTTYTYVAPAPTYLWQTSNGNIIQSKDNMIPADPIGTSAPPLPVVGYVAVPQKVKVVSPRRFYRSYGY